MRIGKFILIPSFVLGIATLSFGDGFIQMRGKKTVLKDTKPKQPAVTTKPGSSANSESMSGSAAESGTAPVKKALGSFVPQRPQSEATPEPNGLESMIQSTWGKMKEIQRKNQENNDAIRELEKEL
jgi:hypothetical protein